MKLILKLILILVLYSLLLSIGYTQSPVPFINQASFIRSQIQQIEKSEQLAPNSQQANEKDAAFFKPKCDPDNSNKLVLLTRFPDEGNAPNGSPVLSDGNSDYSHGLGLDSDYNSGQSNWYSQDHLGTTNALYNNEGNANNQLAFDAWGKNTQLSGDMNTPFGYGGSYGYQTDNDSGLLLVGHRYYDPGIGRFFSVDPIHDGLNLYAYVGNNPVSLIDPKGLFQISAGFGIVGALPGMSGWVDAEIIVEIGWDTFDVGFGQHIGAGGSEAFGYSGGPFIGFSPNGGRLHTESDNGYSGGIFAGIGVGGCGTITRGDPGPWSGTLSAKYGPTYGGGAYGGYQFGETFSIGEWLRKYGGILQKNVEKEIGGIYGFPF